MHMLLTKYIIHKLHQMQFFCDEVGFERICTIRSLMAKGMHEHEISSFQDEIYKAFLVGRIHEH